MKRTSTFFLLVAALLAACTDSGSDTIEFEKVSVKRTVNLTKDQDSPQCHLQLEVMQAKPDTSAAHRLINEAVIKKIFYFEGLTVKEAADSFANVYTRSYQQDLAPLYREDRSDQAKHPWYEYRYTVTTDAHPGRPGITCYLVNLDYYEGGAHGITQLLTLNFDNKTGKSVKLSDLMQPDYEQKLNELLLKALLKKTGAKDLDALHDQGYLYSMYIFAPENYLLESDGITFVYNPYELAPYSEGIIKLTIDYDDLEKLLK